MDHIRSLFLQYVATAERPTIEGFRNAARHENFTEQFIDTALSVFADAHPDIPHYLKNHKSNDTMKTQDTMNAQDTLNRAADHIEKVGWHQGSMTKVPFDEMSPCCLVGAINAVASDWAELNAAELEVAKRLRARGWKWLIAAWNDLPERTVQEVLDLLRGTK